MSVLYIAEFSFLAPVTQGNFVEMKVPAPVAQVPPIAEQTVSISGSHAESSAFNASTRFVRVETDAICSIAFGTSPVATTSNMRLAANQTEYFGVAPGSKISVISNT